MSDGIKRNPRLPLPTDTERTRIIAIAIYVMAVEITKPMDRAFVRAALSEWHFDTDPTIERYWEAARNVERALDGAGDFGRA